MSDPIAAYASWQQQPPLGVDPQPGMGRDRDLWTAGYRAANPRWRPIADCPRSLRSFLLRWPAIGTEPVVGHQGAFGEWLDSDSLRDPTKPGPTHFMELPGMEVSDV